MTRSVRGAARGRPRRALGPHGTTTTCGAAGVQLRVLFIHGLESGPNGSKVRLLRAQGFEVAAADMHLSMWRLRQRNAVGRNLVRHPELWLVAGSVFLAVALGIGLGVWPVAAAGLVAGVLAPPLRWRRWMGAALERSRATCVRIQRDALAEHRPDVVVGSSWGGAVAAELILGEWWQGPTVLLAPAIRKLQLAIDPAPYPALVRALREHAARAPLVVFHDPADDVIPFEGTRDLAHGVDGTGVARGEGGPVRLREVAGGGHRLMCLLDDGRLADAIREVTAAPSGR